MSQSFFPVPTWNTPPPICRFDFPLCFENPFHQSAIGKVLCPDSPRSAGGALFVVVVEEEDVGLVGGEVMI